LDSSEGQDVATEKQKYLEGLGFKRVKITHPQTTAPHKHGQFEELDIGSIARTVRENEKRAQALLPQSFEKTQN